MSIKTDINPTLETSYDLANLLKDVQALQAQSEAGNGGRHLGTARILVA